MYYQIRANLLESVHSRFGSGNRWLASVRPRLEKVGTLGCADDVTTNESEGSVDCVDSPMDVMLVGKLGMFGIVGTGGRLPWEIFSTNFSADLTAVGLLLLRIQFCNSECMYVRMCDKVLVLECLWNRDLNSRLFYCLYNHSHTLSSLSSTLYLHTRE